MFHSKRQLQTEKAIALLSGGLDSTVSLVDGMRRYEVVMALTFNYGQRAFGKEIKASRSIAEYYGIHHEVIVLPWLSGLLPKALMIRREGLDPIIPDEWSDDANHNKSFFEAKPVWVPNRNGLFLNIAAVYAEVYQAQVIIFGANREEGESFPDNTDEFRKRITDTFKFSTLNHPRVECPMGALNKAQIINRAQELRVPLNLVWSCYADTELQCGYCPSCYRLKHALECSKANPELLSKVSFVH